jgi:uncharacterized protein (DUF2141 family)
MRLSLSLAVALLSATSVHAEPSAANLIRAEIGGLRSPRGVVRCLLFQGEDGFPSKAANASQRAVVTIVNGAAVCEFADPPAGTLAIAFIHDENGNGELDKNFFGVPQEGYGFSNDARGSMGPPAFDKAAFQHAPGVQVLHLSVVY